MCQPWMNILGNEVVFALLEMRGVGTVGTFAANGCRSAL